MSRPKVTYAELRRMMLDLGFTETVVPRSHSPGPMERRARRPAVAGLAHPGSGLISIFGPRRR
jgi:hypothetical protein